MAVTLVASIWEGLLNFAVDSAEGPGIDLFRTAGENPLLWEVAKAELRGLGINVYGHQRMMYRNECRLEELDDAS